MLRTLQRYQGAKWIHLLLGTWVSLGDLISYQFKLETGWRKDFKKKLALWKRRFLSKGGRLNLVKSTPSSLCIHFMSSYVIPRKVSLRVEKVQ